MLAVVVDLLAAPQIADHLDSLLQHRQAQLDRRPAITEDVLVEGLTGTDAELEPTVEQHRAGRRRLGDDRRVDAHRRAGHGRADVQVGDGGDGPDHAPHERAVALLVEPRMEVVRDPHSVDAGLFGEPCLVDERRGWVLLTGQEVADLHGR